MMVLYSITLALFFLMSIVLILTILVQEGSSSGLGSTFGGDTRDSLFGASTPEVLKKFTAGLAALFLALSLVLSLWTSHLGREPDLTPQFTIESPTSL